MKMSVMRCAGRRLAVPLVALGLVSPGTARADLAAEMNTMFNTMSSTTPPAAYSTAMRGVISGGGISVSNHQVTTNLVAITPPGFKAGCGGIDLFGGSFSFINAAQFETMLRSIASNAQGYAFEVAMNAMCPNCMATIESLARKMQSATDRLSNSCQLAEGIVNDAAGAVGVQTNNKASITNMLSGAKSDAFAAFNAAADALSPVETAVKNTPAKAATQLQGNVTWRALVNQRAAGAFANVDQSLLEVLMNIGGTVIVGGLAPDSVDGTTQNLNEKTIPGRPDLVDSLINGGTVNILVCQPGDLQNPNGCLTPGQGTITLTGFKTSILTAFEGPPGAGILDAVVTNAALTDAQKTAIGLMPFGLSGLIIRMASASPPAAKALVEDVAPQLALLMTEALVGDMMRAIRASVSASQDPRAKDVGKMVDDSWKVILARESQLQMKLGSLPDVIRTYQSLLGIVPALPRGLGTSSALAGPNKW